MISRDLAGKLLEEINRALIDCNRLLESNAETRKRAEALITAHFAILTPLCKATTRGEIYAGQIRQNGFTPNRTLFVLPLPHRIRGATLVALDGKNWFFANPTTDDTMFTRPDDWLYVAAKNVAPWIKSENRLFPKATADHKEMTNDDMIALLDFLSQEIAIQRNLVAEQLKINDAHKDTMETAEIRLKEGK